MEGSPRWCRWRSSTSTSRGDIHAVSAANNLLAAMLDASILHGNKLKIDPLRVGWRRAVDINDRALRQITIGQGGRANGYPRETGFDITAASEVMAILAVARDLQDLRRRLGAITVAYSFDGGKPISAEDLHAAGALTVLLKDAIKPNLVQTLEGQPALVHCGPFANIAHGNNSLIADLVALKLGEYVVTESGFGPDMGMEKLIDIVCRIGEIAPSAVVLVTVRALKHHGRHGEEEPTTRAQARHAIEEGAANMHRHLGIVREFGLPCVVAVNRMPGDDDTEVELVKELAVQGGAHAAEVSDGFPSGGSGAAALAEAVVDACSQPASFRLLYDCQASITDKIEAVAKRVYGAKDVYYYGPADQKIAQFTNDGLGELPVCMAKTHLSLSADSALLNAPKDFTVPIVDVRAYTGVGRFPTRGPDDPQVRVSEMARVCRRGGSVALIGMFRPPPRREGSARAVSHPGPVSAGDPATLLEGAGLTVVHRRSTTSHRSSRAA